MCVGHSLLWHSLEQYWSSRHRAHRLTGVNFPQTVQPGLKEVLLSMDEDGIAGIVGTMAGKLVAKPTLSKIQVLL